MFFGYLGKLLRHARTKSRETVAPAEPVKGDFAPDIKSNMQAMHALLGDSSDIIEYSFTIGHDERPAAIYYVEGLVDTKQINEFALTPLSLLRLDDLPLPADMETLRATVLASGGSKVANTIGEAAETCLTGETVLLVEGYRQAGVLNTRGWDRRSVSEPQSESVVRGPREGFTETLRTNTALLRRRLRSPQLRMKAMKIGRHTQTDICMVYLEGIVNQKVLNTLRQRLEAIDIDSVLDSGYIEQYIEDAPLSPFATVAYSEKPDVVVGKVLEGRIAIVVDGSPLVLTVPMLMVESFQSAEDYYVRPIYATLLRWIRYTAFFISLLAPAIYIALMTYHQEFLPTTLLFSIAAAREGIPFTAFIEALLMVVAYEILREAGVRLPRPVGQAISIVGALVMGDAAVSAGLVGAPMVITIAITAVAGFTVPDQNDACMPLRLILMVAAAALGGFGIAMCLLAILVHLASLESFGIPYFSGFYPSRDLKDTVIRAPLWEMRKRPGSIARKNIIRRAGR